MQVGSLSAPCQALSSKSFHMLIGKPKVAFHEEKTKQKNPMKRLTGLSCSGFIVGY